MPWLSGLQAKLKSSHNVANEGTIEIQRKSISIKIANRYKNAVMDDCSEPLKEYCLRWLQTPQEIPAPLIMGAAGVGKTYILNALYEILNKKDYLSEDTGVTLVNATNLICDIKNGIANNQSNNIIDNYKKTKILMIDDIGADRITDYTKELVYIILDYRYNWCLPTPMTTNYQLSELRNLLGERITSRIIGMTKQFVISGKDRRLSKLKEERSVK